MKLKHLFFTLQLSSNGSIWYVDFFFPKSNFQDKMRIAFNGSLESKDLPVLFSLTSII